MAHPLGTELGLASAANVLSGSSGPCGASPGARSLAFNLSLFLSMYRPLRLYSNSVEDGGSGGGHTQIEEDWCRGEED